jgi:hypothetical protein
MPGVTQILLDRCHDVLTASEDDDVDVDDNDDDYDNDDEDYKFLSVVR